MGCASSRQASEGKGSGNFVDQKLSEALRKARGRNDRKHHTLNELLLQFPKLKTGECRDSLPHGQTQLPRLPPAREPGRCAKTCTCVW